MTDATGQIEAKEAEYLSAVSHHAKMQSKSSWQRLMDATDAIKLACVDNGVDCEGACPWSEEEE